MNNYILFMVRYGPEVGGDQYNNVKVFVWALDREGAKRSARQWMSMNPDTYIVEPLTNKGDRVKLDITLNV